MREVVDKHDLPGQVQVCQIYAKAAFVRSENQRFSSVIRNRQALQVTVMVKIAI